jgi:hypothetical protein
MELVFAHAVELAKVLHEFPSGHAVIDCRVIAYKPDLTANLSSMATDVESTDQRNTTRSFHDSAQNPQNRCLSRAIGA